MKSSCLAATCVVVLMACGGGSGRTSGFAPVDEDGADAASDSGVAQPTVDASKLEDAGGGGPLFDDDGSVGDGSTSSQTGKSEVYGNSPTTLYVVDPDTKAMVAVGVFDGCTSIADIALDKDSNLYGTTSTALWSIDRKTAKCTKIAAGSYPNSLSFVPAGTLDPSVEALVGYVSDTYVRIDTKTGAISNVGTIGGGLASSGDIVSVKGGGTYLTVTGTNCNDCIIEVNPATGGLVKNWGSVGHPNVFGLAFWAGTVFGFDSGGDLFEVTFGTATITTTTLAIPNAPSGLQFWGAGSTTSAPVKPQ